MDEPPGPGVDLRSIGLTLEGVEAHFEFDDRLMEFDFEALLEACPFLRRA